MPGWLMTHDMWTQIFALGAPLVEKMLRPIAVYAFLVVVLRIFGKRELAQLNPFDLVVLLSLSNTVQNAIIGNDNSLTGGLVGAFTLLGMNYVVVRFLFRHRRLDQVFEGKPTVLIADGKIVKHSLAKELLTRGELLTVLHRQGYESLHDVEKCVLEPGGTFFIQGKTPATGELHHSELLKRLEELAAKVDALAKK
ncbi:MAG TPA: YetF domain-containing protein [Bryobacteraceae bacterium]|nr:YetF domain-containing protein [Bryobacteraceae bacterium]